MTAASLIARPAASDVWRALRPAVPALGLGLVVWALLFHTEIVQAVKVWNASTAYSHCWPVLPIAAYLAWDRRDMARGIPVQPLPWPALLAIPGGLVWLAAERVGIMEGRQLAAIGFVELLFLCVLGWRLAWAFSAPLLYLVFLVPFGAFVTPALQRFTTGFTDVGLDLLGIPYYTDQFTIEIPAGTFYVAEACAGLRFLMPAIAFGVLYACLIYRSFWRRAAFIAASCVVPVIANGFRALGIVAAGHLVGNAEAAAADHIIYGWIFFSFVILLLILAGLPFRQDQEAVPPAAAPAEPRPSRPAAPWVAAGAVLGMAAIGPAVAVALEFRNGATAVSADLPAFLPGPDCVAAGPSSAGIQHFTCGAFALTATLQVFPPRTNPGVLQAAWRAVAAEDRAEETVTDRITGTRVQPHDWRLVETEKPDRSTASALWIDGEAGLGGLEGRLRQARNSVLGKALAPVLMAVGVETAGAMDRRQRQEARAVIRNFLDAQGDLDARAVAVARAR